MFYNGSLKNGVNEMQRTFTSKGGVDIPFLDEDTPMFFLTSLGGEEIAGSGM